MGKMGEKLSNELGIRDIFENGSNNDVKLLLDFEKDLEVDEKTRAMITKVRERLEAKGTFMSRSTPVSTSGRAPELDDLETTEEKMR